MRKIRSKRPAEDPFINITPLIDVVFVILFAFIVAAPLLEMDQVQLAQAGENKGNTLENAPVTIHVHADNSIICNGQSVTLPHLSTHLLQAKKKYPQGKAQVFHDKEASFGTYQSVKNALEGAGFKEMNVILKPN